MGAAASCMRSAWFVATGACLALSGCGPVGADANELFNIDPDNIVPKSTPRQIALAFERSCIDGPGSFAAAEAQLRHAGFVPLPQNDAGYVAFVSDDKRPMVMIAKDGAACMVGARSRTGQTAALNELVAERFPDAAPLPPAQLAGFELEQGWRVSGAIVFLKRIASAYSDSRLMFGIWRTT